ncbi:c-type cytochrome [Marichromatium bheemlicum]|uniref:Cytochrome c n=1 Tax=Marichromatium bheemlicum TaxID=365339 RepID=A0ABX1I438_9GAMM|nr:cytochrome c [Marichromatium bheemlicum]NKN31868.1 cytochrome c [Marichromatium bheemlicum]
MKRMPASAVAGVLTVALASAATAAELKPEEQIQYRQAGYSFMAWNMGKIKANLQGDFDQGQVEAAANAIAAIANSGMGALYGPGTDKNVGDVETAVKPEFFQNMEEAGKVARNFIAAANNMAEVAAGGDQGAVKDAFGELGQSCKSCHDKFRADD